MLLKRFLKVIFFIFHNHMLSIQFLFWLIFSLDNNPLFLYIFYVKTHHLVQKMINLEQAFLNRSLSFPNLFLEKYHIFQNTFFFFLLIYLDVITYIIFSFIMILQIFLCYVLVKNHVFYIHHLFPLIFIFLIFSFLMFFHQQPEHHLNIIVTF